MTNFWEDLKKNITEWSIVASEKAEEFTHTSKLRIDVIQLERKLSSNTVTSTKCLKVWSETHSNTNKQILHTIELLLVLHLLVDDIKFTKKKAAVLNL